MIKRRLFCMAVLLAACLLTGQVASATVVLSHYTDANPGTEGWGDYGGGGTGTPIAGEAWEIDCAAGENLPYYSGLAPDWRSAAVAQGFVCRASVKLIGDQPVGQQLDCFFGSGSGGPAFVIEWSQSGSDVTVVFERTQPQEVSYTITGGAGSYHLYEIVYDPCSDTGDLWIDGAERLSNVPSHGAGSIQRVLWGNGDSAESTVRYELVELDVNFDADADGVPDSQDLCPDSDPCYPVDINGCTDTDGDGVADVNDLCPDTVPGTWIDPCGCPVPDTDGDGVYDPCDLCPGSDPCYPVDLNGCTDTDGDGIADLDDLCPDTPPGTHVDPSGCPVTPNLVMSHYTDADPTTEGWSYTDTGATEGPIPLEAWQITCDSGQIGLYSSNWDPCWLTSALTHGFTYRASVRLEDEQDPSHRMDVFLGDIGFYSVFWEQAGSDVIARIKYTLAEEITHTITGGAGSYHLYEIVYDPVAQHADILIDGSPVATDVPPGEANLSFFRWGSAQQTPGAARYALMEMDVEFDDDGDGVPNSRDLCPDSDPCYPVDVNGCIDTDGDGVADADDLCPATAPGTWVDQDGCPVPDTDGDGVYDPCDLCPGSDPCYPVDVNGCTDTDGDGVADTEDLCPDTPPGTQVNADGCPDADGDGVADANDLCPDTPPGTPVYPDGCPISTEFIAVISTQASAWGDYNNDGYSDMFGGNDVWTNNGDGTFTHSTPLSDMGYVSLGDYNNDGFIDVASLKSGGVPALQTNNGDGTWTWANDKFAPGSNPWNVAGTTFGDWNGDGYLDTYWTGWYTYTSLDCDVIYMSNEAQGFHHSWTADQRHGKGVALCDFDEDADADILVSNYWGEASYLWRNDGFDGNTGLTDIAGGLDGGGHTQGSTWGDFDNDGHLDIFIANFAHPGNPECRFQQNQGPPGYGFTDLGKRGVTQVEPLSAATTGDFDNDGYLDMVVTVSSGYNWTDIMVYSNNGDFTFTEVSSSVGLAGLGPDDEAAWGDYNNDGYLDLLVADTLYRNPGGPRHWVKLKLLGGPHPDGLVNGSAIGAQARITVPGLGILTRQVAGNTGAWGMQNDQVLHFGLGDYSGTTVDVDILWPNGYEETIYDVPIDQPAPIVIQLLPPVTVPPCWDYLTQCHGDVDGDGDVDTVDWPIFRDSFGYAYPSPDYHPCGDMDHDGDVDTVDWPEFRDNFGYAAPADCTPGGAWPPTP